MLLGRAFCDQVGGIAQHPRENYWFNHDQSSVDALPLLKWVKCSAWLLRRGVSVLIFQAADGAHHFPYHCGRYN